MTKKPQKSIDHISSQYIRLLFNLLFVLTPLIFAPVTSELFEFNKMVVIYIITLLISSFWVIEIIIKKTIIFKRTPLDIPLLLFLGSQIISTLFSRDIYTSIFGYYSRFNGGLLSTTCYLILYLAFVSHFDKTSSLKLIRNIFLSSCVVAIWGILEHFSFSPSCLILTGQANAACWVQDVANRVFATFGQPNWLAAYMVALIPLTWAMSLISKRKLIYIFLSLLFFTTLLFTKSRSGLLGFITADLLFWFLVWKLNKFKLLNLFVICNLLFAISFLLINTPWSPKNSGLPSEASAELGGTESGHIRQIVWQGALNIWKNHPLVGTGVETFAYAYYEFRPLAHNLTSEWDFLYNKAHNEFLNIASNTGLIGILTYAAVIVSSIFIFLKNKSYLGFALLAGFASLLVTNFFGFGVTTTSLQFFLYPAIAISLKTKKLKQDKNKNLSQQQKVTIALSCILALFLLCSILRYWFADTLYAKGKAYASNKDYEQSAEALDQAISINPHVAIYHDELANTLAEAGLIDAALAENNLAISMSPHNINLKKSKSNILINLAQIDKNYLKDVVPLLTPLLSSSPTDPAIPYKLALAYANLGDMEIAKKLLEHSLLLKPDYQNAKVALDAIREIEAK